MKILLIGSGGREHALAWRLAQSLRISRLWCAPGNAGIAGERLARSGAAVELVPLAAEAIDELVEFARQQRPDLTVIGPDNPLALGLVDRLAEAGLRAWGPNRRAAQFESSKAFAQAFMERHGIPTARAGIFTEIGPAEQFVRELGGRCVVKADGLALGKGALVCAEFDEARRAIEELLVRRTLGEAGARIVIQEFLEGMEVSLHALCDGRTARLFPTAQDHKRIHDGDRGPNTGGMGAYSPTPFLDAAALAEIQRRIMDPWLAGCAAERLLYRGILYPGIMLTREGPKVLEFNARFGDPETQVFLTRLRGDLLDLIEASVEGTLRDQPLDWRPEAAICVVMASAGYPGDYPKGKVITGLAEAARLADIKVFHAGTGRRGDEIITTGGRVLGVTAWARGLARARELAYQAVPTIHFEGAQYRTDIGAKAL